MQSYPLDMKIALTRNRIHEWVYQFGEDGVAVSFSGGKDSTVLLHLVRTWFPDVKAVFSNTGLEFPEIQKFVKSFDNVDIVTPSMNFGEVISTYGYPLIGKEVAEAIYYARRIRPAERERERESESRQPAANRRNSWANEPHINESRRKQTDDTTRSMGLQRDWKRLEIGGAEPQESGDQRFAHDRREPQPKPQSRGSETFWKRAEITGRYRNSRKAGVAGPTKSQFNKEKWLPLARDAPFLISHYCCFKMKKSPMHKYQTAHDYKPFLATLAEESRVRKQAWIRHGCNAFDSKNPTSQPMSFWTEQDVLAYIVKYNLPIASVYGDIVSRGSDGNDYSPLDINGDVKCNLHCTGCQRTGCIFCAFGAHLEKGETRFQRLAKTHPRQYEYCIGGGEWIDNPFYDPAAPVWDGEWKNWNPKKIWSRNGKGLGLGKVFDICNEMYGKDFIRYD